MIGENCLIVFTRFPRSGVSKTRLAKELGNEIAIRLHRAFLRDIFSRFANRDFDLVVAGATGDAEEEFRRLAENCGTFDWFFYPRELRQMSRFPLHMGWLYQNIKKPS